MKLLKVIKNPITDHLPVGCRKIAMSFNANKIQNPRELVPPDEPIAIVVGAMAHGQVYINEYIFYFIYYMKLKLQVKPDYIEDTISISNYPLSGALTCSKLCTAFEEVWKII